LQADRIISYEGVEPTLGENVFVAPGAYVIGDVEIGNNASIWYGSVVRGDIHYVRIGAGTNIQDGTVVHVTHDTGPVVVGSDVTIGHRVVLHGCTVEDLALVGMGSVVLDGAVVEKYSMVAAGAVVTPGTVVQSGMLFAGLPAKPLRELTAEEMRSFEESAAHYREYAEAHIASL
jgi:carbonic anhydrase/acetyltransferase-like protein (isoleucine patch superfamily)